MNKPILALLAASTTLAGCATTSFAPPTIDLDSSIGTRTAAFQTCEKLERGKKLSLGSDRQKEIKENFEGAMMLIDNFMVGYRCSERSLAEGRSKFEIPAFLLGATAALGQPFGISEDATIALGAGAVSLSQGNSYFAPQAKADFLNSAIDALTCIQLESVGVTSFDINGDEDSGAGKSNAGESKDTGTGPSVSVSGQRQYFRMVYGALLSVERILARRLNHAGAAFDPSGIVAEIELLTLKESNNPPTGETGTGDGSSEIDPAAGAEGENGEAGAEGEAAENGAAEAAGEAPQDGGNGTTTMSVLNGDLDKILTDTVRPVAGSFPNSDFIDLLTKKLEMEQKAQANQEILRIKSIQPRLQKCVVRAKV